MDNIVTCDLSDFGIKELIEASTLLKAYANNKAVDFLGVGLTLNFNRNSGYVFLSDEDYNVGILDDNNEIVQFYSCPQCGNEGTDADYEFVKYEGYCSKECHDKNL